MAYPSDFFATIIDSMNRVADQWQGQIGLIDTVWTDFSPEPGVRGGTTQITFPGLMTAADRANASLSFTTPTSSTKTVTLTVQPHVAWRVHDLNAMKANPTQLENVYIKPGMVSLANALDIAIAALFVSGTMSSYTPIASAATKVVVPAQIRDARIAMRANKVPVDDYGDVFLSTPTVAYDRMLTEDNYAKYDITAEEATVAAKRRSIIMPQMNAIVRADDNLNVATQYNSALYHRSAIGMAIRPLEIPTGPAAPVEASYVNYRGIIIRVMHGYSMEYGAWMVSMDFVYGLTVLRPEACCLIYSALS